VQLNSKLQKVGLLATVALGDRCYYSTRPETATKSYWAFLMNQHIGKLPTGQIQPSHCGTMHFAPQRRVRCVGVRTMAYVTGAVRLCAESPIDPSLALPRYLSLQYIRIHRAKPQQRTREHTAVVDSSLFAIRTLLLFLCLCAFVVFVVFSRVLIPVTYSESKDMGHE
jgi:hypothetical protein